MILLFAALALQGTAPAATPTPADWRTRPLTAGAWTWRSSAQSSEALFSDSLGVQLIVRCTRATRQVSFSRPGAAPTAAIRIATTSSQRQLPPGQTVLSSDPLLDAIAFSRGRLLVDAAATMPLVVRAAPEPARAIEDCRS
ncbi:hypothetical protein GCM10022280_12750 [Sphingomonas swuensis]|uniref:Uncharacterized protein n=1 Tax=Sphingomonas swuensis TaxID=977800 RepID=A0ABP7SRZ4_9SPHN